MKMAINNDNDNEDIQPLSKELCVAIQFTKWMTHTWKEQINCSLSFH